MAIQKALRFVSLAVTSAMVLATITGCGYDRSSRSFAAAYSAGQFDQACVEVDKVVGPVKDDKGASPAELLKVSSTDAVVYRLEQGAIHRAAGRIDESTLALRHADELIHQADEKADLRLSEEAAAAAANQTYRDYTGYNYDRLALNIYLALNSMQAGRLDDARTALRAMQETQAIAEERFRKEIEAVEKKTANGKTDSDQSADAARTLNDPTVQAAFHKQYGPDVALAPDRSAYKPFSNPFGEYLQGIYFIAAGLGGSDAETAVTAFKRVQGMLPDNPYVAEDLAVADKVASGAPVPPTTYVLFETGLGPVRDSFRIDLPVFVVSLAARKDLGVDYVGAAFPYLKFRDGHVPSLDVLANGSKYRTAVFTDMDEVVRKEFNNDLPLVITRTIISTVTKAAAAYGLHKASEGNVYANILTRVSTTVYQAAMNEADLRAWQSLPKQFQAARFPTPADRVVTLALPDGAALPPVKLHDGRVNVVYVKSVQAGQPVSVQQFVLK